MKIGLKLWSHNLEAYYVEAQRLFREKFIDYLEIHVPNGTLSHITEWKKLDIPYTIQCDHSAINLANASKDALNDMFFLETRRYAEYLKPDFIVVTGGVGGDAQETARQIVMLKTPGIIIRNKPFCSIPKMGPRQSYRGSTKAELEIIMSTTGCGFCLDFVDAVCAANSQKLDIYEYIEDLMTLNPCMFRLGNMADSTAEEPTRRHLANGNLDVDRLLSALPPDAKLTLETEKDSVTSLSDFEADVLYARKFAKSK